MKTQLAQQIIRELSPDYLANNPPIFGKKEAVSGFQPTGQESLSKPSTIAELAEALRHPLPPPPERPRCYNALEAAAAYKPLTMEMVRDLMAKERAAREVIMLEYTARTGQRVDYCDQCDMGVVEEEMEQGWQTVVVPRQCEACDGLGVVAI